MLFVLKRPVSKRRFVRAPKTHAKTDGYKNIFNLILKIYFSGPVLFISLVHVDCDPCLSHFLNMFTVLDLIGAHAPVR